jgi:hypothetical protein
MQKLLTLTLALAVLATFDGLATAATTVNNSKSNNLRQAPGQAAPKQMTGKVTAVNNQAKTFTVMSQGKTVVVSGAKLSKLPTVGQVVDITYTETPGGGPLESSNLNSSRSNTF